MPQIYGAEGHNLFTSALPSVGLQDNVHIILLVNTASHKMPPFLSKDPLGHQLIAKRPATEMHGNKIAEGYYRNCSCRDGVLRCATCTALSECPL